MCIRDRNKILTVYNPIDQEQILLKSNEYIPNEIKGEYVISVGRLSAVKNLTLMIDAFSLISKGKNLKLLIVGDGELYNDLCEYIENKKLSTKVILLGAMSNPFPLMKYAKLILSSSLSEALPTVFLESFALGKTVVATPTMGAIDLLRDGKLGYISDSLTGVDDFAKKINQAYDNPLEPSVLLGEAQKFSIENKVKELERILD